MIGQVVRRCDFTVIISVRTKKRQIDGYDEAKIQTSVTNINCKLLQKRKGTNPKSLYYNRCMFFLCACACACVVCSQIDLLCVVYTVHCTHAH